MNLINSRYSNLYAIIPLILLFFIAEPRSAYAQERLKFSIVDFDVDQFDLSAKDKRYEKFDHSGDRYAIIKVTSANPDDKLSEYNFNFGNMMHTVEEHDGTLWIYVQRNAKLVTITRAGYAPVNRYDLHTTIESGRNYVMTLSAEQRRVYTEMVQFNVSPADARAVIMVKNVIEGSNEELFGYTDASGSVAKTLELGTYNYRVLADKYKMAEGRFTLNNRTETFIENVALQPNFSELTFNVDADADIYINGQKMGTRQWSGTLKAGNYEVECRQPNHKPTTEFIQVTDNDKRTIELKAPTPIVGTLAIVSSPLGAEINVDGKEYGLTPKSIDLTIGEHKVELIKPGYNTKSETFEIKEGITNNLNLKLNRLAVTEITTEPEGAKLYLDGRFMGNTPFTYDGITGKRKLKLTLKNYKPVSETVDLGNTPELAYTLIEKTKSGGLLRKNDLYIQAGIGLGAAMNVTAAVGGHFANVNAEAYYSYSFSKSPEIYWYYDSGSFGYGPCTYTPSLILGGKLGYGFNIGSRVNLTPQAGFRFTKFSGKISYGGTAESNGAYCGAVTIGVRGYFAITRHIGVSLTPEYAIGVSKSAGYQKLTGITSKIKNMAEGFDAKLSFVFTL